MHERWLQGRRARTRHGNGVAQATISSLMEASSRYKVVWERFRLVVVVVTDEIVYGVVGKKE